MAPATRDAVVRMLDYRPADVTSAEDVRRLVGEDHPNTLVYLALPPFLLESVLPALATAGLGTSDAVAIEKPFGTDLASAQHLNEVLRIQLPRPTIFRIDHFLSNELVRRDRHPALPQPDLRAGPGTPCTSSGSTSAGWRA